MAWLVNERGRVLGTLDVAGPLIWRTEDSHGLLIPSPIALWSGLRELSDALALSLDTGGVVRRAVRLRPWRPRLLVAPATIVVLPRALWHDAPPATGDHLEVRR